MRLLGSVVLPIVVWPIGCAVREGDTSAEIRRRRVPVIAIELSGSGGYIEGMKKPAMQRPDWDTYFMDIARVAATRGNCIRRRVGSVIVKDTRIIATGYNGTPRGIRNCCDGGCPRCAGSAPSGKDLAECICSHAEENAITQAACHGISVNGATLYCTASPCLICAKMIINSGILSVVYEEKYCFNTQTRALLAEAGVKCRQFKRKS